MSILDGTDHTFSAIINGVEHFAGDMETLVEHSCSELTSLGIYAVGSISWLVQHLISLGEDPVDVISKLRSRITDLGGDVASTLEEVAFGVMTYGMSTFAQKKSEQAISPLQETVRQNTARGQDVAAIHDTTLKTVRAKLDGLQAGGNLSGVAWQGQSVDAMNTSYGDISNTINALTDQIRNDGTQAKLNEACLIALGVIVIGGVIILILDIAATAVVEIASVGVLTLPVLVIDAAIIGADLSILLILIGVDLAFWLAGTLAIYTTQHPISFTHPSPTTPGQITILHAGDLPKGDITNPTNKNRRRYIPPKNSGGHVTKSPNGKGFIDDKGNVWEWAQDPHGGPHWDVQHPKSKKHTNVGPDGNIIGDDNFPNDDSLVKPDAQPKK